MKKINKLLFAFMFIAMFTGLCFGIVANKNNQEINISTPLQQQNSETLSANLSASSETQTSTENITVTYGEKVILTATVAVSDTNISNESYVWQKKSGEIVTKTKNLKILAICARHVARRFLEAKKIPAPKNRDLFTCAEANSRRYSVLAVLRGMM